MSSDSNAPWSTLWAGDNSHIFQVENLRDHLDVVQTDATVQVLSLLKRNGDPVAGFSAPLSLPHVADGTYRAVVAPGLDITVGLRYVAKFSAVVASTGLHAEWDEILTCRTRSA